MQQNGWQGEPLNVLYRDGVPTSMDNRRLLAARRAGIEVPVRVRSASDPLTPSQVNQFWLATGYLRVGAKPWIYGLVVKAR